MTKILTAKIDGKREIHFPESKLEQYQEHFGNRMELIVPEPQTSRFVSLDEQRAATTAIEEEQHPSRFCPNCGREMEYDGVWYCENCEG